jgi:hypothetical protein
MSLFQKKTIDMVSWYVPPFNSLGAIVGHQDAYLYTQPSRSGQAMGFTFIHFSWPVLVNVQQQFVSKVTWRSPKTVKSQ